MSKLQILRDANEEYPTRLIENEGIVVARIVHHDEQVADRYARQFANARGLLEACKTMREWLETAGGWSEALEEQGINAVIDRAGGGEA